MSLKIRQLSPRQKARLDVERAILRSWPRPAIDLLVFDLGVEHGDSGRVVREVLGYEGVSLYGCDLWEPNATAAHASGVYDAVRVSDARNDAREKVDVFLCCELLEHLPREDGERFLRDMVANVRPGGLVVVSAPIGFMVQGAIDGNPHEEHVSAWSPADLDAHGFRVVSVLPEHRLFVAAYTKNCRGPVPQKDPA